MTTPPVVSITDELVAELERAISENRYIDMHPEDMKAILAERAELKRDAERMNFVEQHPGWLHKHKKHWSCVNPATNYEYPVFSTAREAIDAAMQK